MQDPAQPIAVGTKIGPYEIVSLLGAGGMGVVYRARDARLGRDVAIKLIPDTLAMDAGRVNRFEQEARAAGQLNHPNILAVYDVGVHASAPYIVSELLEGESLRSRLEGGALPFRKATDYARQTAIGLAAAHDKGIVHRDVKPDNLFITNDGRIKILDFGIAKLTLPADAASGHTGRPTGTAAGMVVGTAGYMSPEQVRGESVDARSDIFSVGTVLHEMLTGRSPFTRDTMVETMSAILKEDPADRLPANVPISLARIVSRCLEKTRDMRFQSARDLAFGLEVLSDTGATAVSVASHKPPWRWRTALGVTVVVLSLLTAAASWLTRRTESTPPPVENPLADARFSRLTDWEGTESAAEISPDGKFVLFIADRDGELDLFLNQVGTGSFQNLTKDIPSLGTPGVILRNYGFSGDGAEIWFSFTGDPGEPKVLMPLTGGTPRPFLDRGYNAPSWSADGSRLAYFVNGDGDPLFVADRSGADASPILASGNDSGFFAKGMHSHNPIWSTDGEWIYFVHGPEPTEEMDVWRARRSGGSLERLTEEHAPINFLAALDPRTLLYVARARDRSGPWLWSLDVERKVARRVTSGLEQYKYISASRDGRRLVATVANPTASLLRVPIGARPAEDRDVQPYQLPTPRALAPRFGGRTLFYLSARGTADGLWRFQDGQASEVWKAVDGGLFEPAAVSADGKRVAVLTRRDGKRTIAIMSADGTNSRSLTTPIDIQGAGGQGAADWSPDGAWIVVAASDAQGPGLFKIPVNGGPPVRLVSGPAVNPTWSPDGKLIVYGGTLVGGQVPLLGVRPDGTPVELPAVQVRLGGGLRFLPDGTGLVYLPRGQSPDFWLLDFAGKTTRLLTHLSDQGHVGTFDITPDGKEIVFDRTRENSDIYLIDLPK